MSDRYALSERIDPDFLPIIERVRAISDPPLHTRSAAEVRALMNGLRTADTTPWRPDGLVSQDLHVPADGRQIPVRLYRPAGAGPLPVVVFFHGGGFVIGDLDTHDRIAAGLAHGAHAAVVAVDYRLAPEHPFPAAVEDAAAVLDWIATRASKLDLDSKRIAVAGDSAGGNLAAASTLLARERGGPRLVYQLLFYPDLDTDFDTPSYRAYGEGLLLTTAMSRWYWSQYLGGDPTTDDPLAAPLKAASHAGLPPACIVIAELDALAHEDATYAAKLRAAGVPVEVQHAERLIHGFLRGLGTIPRVDAAFDRATAALGRALHGRNDI